MANLNPRLSDAKATEQMPSFGVEHCCPQRVSDKAGVQAWGRDFLSGR